MRRPIVQVPWAVNALGAAHSLPGGLPCQHLLGFHEVQRNSMGMKDVFCGPTELTCEGQMAAAAAMLKEKITVTDTPHAPARRAKRGSAAGCSGHSRDLPMHHHEVGRSASACPEPKHHVRIPASLFTEVGPSAYVLRMTV